LMLPRGACLSLARPLASGSRQPCAEFGGDCLVLRLALLLQTDASQFYMVLFSRTMKTQHRNHSV
jgi:hypothetical protein